MVNHSVLNNHNITYCNPWFDQTEIQPLGSIPANERDIVDRMQDHTRQIYKEKRNVLSQTENKVLITSYRIYPLPNTLHVTLCIQITTSN